MPRRTAVLLLLLVLVAPARAQEPDIGAELGSVATLPPPGPHRVWVTDTILAHSLLFDGDDGRVLGTVDAGTTLSPKPPLHAPGRGEIYSVEIDYSRGTRGDRIDYVTIYDDRTLAVEGEIVLPTHTSESATSIAYDALLDGERFLATFNQFPVTSVSICDLAARRFVGEVIAAGCAGIYPTGERSYAMLCGDGTALSVTLDEAGAVAAREPSPRFFDAVEDPVMMDGVRLDGRWIWVSFAGVAHELDFAQTPPSADAWPLFDEAERAEGWRPGGKQLVALHRGSQRLYVIVHRGGPGTHKDPGPEVWVWDVARRERVARIPMPNFTAAFVATQAGMPAGGWGHWLLERLLPGGGAHSIAVTQDEAPLLFARHAERGVVAVLDARTGAHLRNLDEAGLYGVRLQVPR